MENAYPARLSVAELRQELDAYLEARREKVESPTIVADKTHVLGFLHWLETGNASRRPDIDGLVQEFTAGE